MNKIFARRIVRLTPMIKNYINTAAILILPTILSSGCTIIPSKNVLTMNKTIELDERAVEDINVGLRFEWIR
jgi:hypothetical protein